MKKRTLLWLVLALVVIWRRRMDGTENKSIWRNNSEPTG